MSLLHFLRFTAPFPVTDSFAASPDLLLYLANLITVRKPGLIVECGSGVSTLVMARTAQLTSNSTRVVALEHDLKYLRSSQQMLSLHGLDDFADIRHAPLRPVDIPDHTASWYDPDRLEGLTDIDVLLVDGPPTATGPSARYPAVPLLHHAFSADATILLDDAARPDETDVATRWATNELSDFERSDIRLSRGLAQFQRTQRAADPVS